MMRIAVAQLEGRTLDRASESLEAATALVAEAAGAGAEIVVLPEGSYPGYVLGSPEAGREALAGGPDPLAAFGGVAAAHDLVLVAGLVVDSPDGLLNAAVTFAPDGSVLSVVAKRFLWHFDAEWFVAGSDSPVVDVGGVTLGSLVCADARVPEIPRTLAVRGAGLVCDPTAWVTATPGAPTNIQPDFLVAARCIENGIVMACASKSGFEGPTVAYAGRSMIVGPTGEVLAEAGSTGEGVVWTDVSLDGLPDPPVERRPGDYGRLLERTPAPAPPSGTSVRVAAANVQPSGIAMRALAAEGVEVVVSPGSVASDGADVRLERFGRDEFLAPEPARIAALAGAELLAVVEGGVPMVVLRARAAENRVFVAAAGDPACVVAPSGAVLADAPASSVRPFVCSAECLLAEAAVKVMAPGSDVLAGRQPESYGDLVS